MDVAGLLATFFLAQSDDASACVDNEAFVREIYLNARRIAAETGEPGAANSVRTTHAPKTNRQAQVRRGIFHCSHHDFLMAMKK